MSLINSLLAILSTFIILGTSCFRGSKLQVKQNQETKLVVGIVVDQMRYDYLKRFSHRYVGGFLKLLEEGCVFENMRYNYLPTSTAPGHASIFTGTTPRYHGIIGNYFFEKRMRKMVYSALDTSVSPIGTLSEKARRSPFRMKAATLGDQLKLSSNFKSKVISASIKDRSAIFSAGNAADAAYWFVGGDEGVFVTSSYYRKMLPTWVDRFNKKQLPRKYLEKNWTLLRPVESYSQHLPDDNPYEASFIGKNETSFPYNLSELSNKNGKLSFVIKTPFGNDLLTDFVIEAIKNENLGKDKFTDLLAISFSSTDIIAHQFGAQSKEIEDTYLRLDKTLLRLIKTLDEEVGENNYVLFLTADHAGAYPSSYLSQYKIKSGYFNKRAFEESLKNFAARKAKNPNVVVSVENEQIYLDYELLKANSVDKKEFCDELVDFILKHKYIAKVYTAKELQQGNFLPYSNSLEHLMTMGYHQKQSGDIFFALEPNVLIYPKQGSTHGTAYNYDTHVPFILFGRGISPQRISTPAHITDIAPTLVNLLKLQMLNTAIGKPLLKVK